jgi:hypothetical protein
VDAERQIQCPGCKNSIFLPGQLLSVAPLLRQRKNHPKGLALEISGILLLAFFPWGTLAGIVLLVLGWRSSFVPVCGNCQRIVKPADSPRCPHCKATFANDN